MDNHSFNYRAYSLIHKLKQLDGAIPYDGDASVQVVFKLANGKTLRIGMTEEVDSIWCDQYEGLFGEFKQESST